MFYTSAVLVAYFLFLISPQAFRLVQNDAQGLPELVNDLATPLGVALVLTVFLPNVPLLSRLDEQSRQWFQSIAEIPQAAQALLQTLKDAKFHVPEDQQRKVKDLMQKHQFDEQDISFVAEGGCAQMWTKIVYFVIIVIQEGKDNKFRGFHRRFPGEYENLKKQYDELEKHCLEWFAEFRQDGHNPDRRLQHIYKDFVSDADVLLDKIYEYLSKALLLTQSSDAARAEQLRKIGFTVDLPRRQLTLDQLAALFLLVEAVLVVCFISMRNTSGNDSYAKMIGKVIMIGLIYLVAVASAIYPKELWRFAQRAPGEGRPWLSYILSGGIGLAAAFVVNLIYNLLVEGGATGPAWDNVRLKYPYLLSAIITSAATAWAIDNRAKEGSQETVQRLIEGSLQGILAGFLGWGVHAMLIESFKMMGHAEDDHGPMRIIVVFAAVGFIIGFCIPHWCRLAKKKGLR